MKKILVSEVTLPLMDSGAYAFVHMLKLKPAKSDTVCATIPNSVVRHINQFVHIIIKETFSVKMLSTAVCLCVNAVSHSSRERCLG